MVQFAIKLGTTPVLITIECRKRKDKSDDTWIEQLITKKTKIGAARTIAVTFSGISEPALKSAALNGIEVRRITEIDDDKIQKWLTIKTTVALAHFSVASFKLDIDCPEGELPQVSQI